MSISLIGILGFLTAAVSILVKVIGLPDQIKKNHKRKSTSGLSVSFFLLGFVSYTLWTVYGLLKKDWVVFFGQSFGMLAMGIIAYQIWIYRDKDEN